MLTQPRTTYHDLVRRDVFTLLPEQLGTVLDFGGGVGATAGTLRREMGAARAVLFDQVADGAATGIDRAVALDLDDLAGLEKALAEEGPFQTVLCLDILEHLRDPWATVQLLDQAMAPGATMIVSLPNVSHLSVVGPLVLSGRFDYEDAGILDRTHLRWFTRGGAVDLATCSGLTLAGCEVNISMRRHQWLNRATLRVFERFFVSQYKLAVRKLA